MKLLKTCINLNLKPDVILFIAKAKRNDEPIFQHNLFSPEYLRIRDALWSLTDEQLDELFTAFYN